MIITRNINGAIQVDGKQIDMYLFICWLLDSYKSQTGLHVRPNRATNDTIKLFVEQEPKAFR